jgi:hypothetical protein
LAATSRKLGSRTPGAYHNGNPPGPISQEGRIAHEELAMFVTCSNCGLEARGRDFCEHCNHPLRREANIAAPEVAQRLAPPPRPPGPEDDPDEPIPVVLPAPRIPPRPPQSIDISADSTQRVFARRAEASAPRCRWLWIAGAGVGAVLVLGVVIAVVQVVVSSAGGSLFGGRPIATSTPGAPDKHSAAERLALQKAPPLSHDTIAKMLALAEPKRQEGLVDLGCGNGALAVQAAADYGLTVVAYDNDPTLVKMAKQRVDDQAIPINPEFLGIKLKDKVLDADLKFADIIVIAHPERWGTLQEVSQQVEPRLLKLKAGVRIVSTQPILRGHPHWKSEAYAPPDDPGRQYTLFVYKTPLD